MLAFILWLLRASGGDAVHIHIATLHLDARYARVSVCVSECATHKYLFAVRAHAYARTIQLGPRSMCKRPSTVAEAVAFILYFFSSLFSRLFSVFRV